MIDNDCSTFSIIHSLNDKSKSYHHHLHIRDYKISLKGVMNVAYKQFNKMQCILNHMLGSTILTSKYPQYKYLIPESYSTLPQPYVICRPEESSQSFMKKMVLAVTF